MKTELTTNHQLQTFLNKLDSHIKRLRVTNENDFQETRHTSDCCNYKIIHEGSYEFCGYCGEPIIREL